MQRKVTHGRTVESCEQTFEKWKEHTAQLLQSSRQSLALVRIVNVSGVEQNRKKGESSSQIVSAFLPPGEKEASLKTVNSVRSCFLSLPLRIGVHQSKSSGGIQEL